MKRLESNLLNMVLVLTISALFAAGALAGVYMLTEEPIRLAKENKKQEALKVVLPEFTCLSEPEIVNDLVVVKAYNNDEFVGAAVESSAVGFSGEIKLIVGFDAEGKIVNYSVLEQYETPGLGTKIVDWFKTDKNRQNICGLNPSQVNFTVDKDGGDIDAITASTISSRAFLAAVQAAYQAYTNNPDYVDSYSGASAQADALPCDTDSLQTTLPDSINKNF
ncbi:MAG TPA: RnfABCDGE type electron transport complex subunit G [Paludibacteraceae bacterium]|jgi:electron transport complex protein RnfG|nr:RnfABCDGE type electron transport complex subunit G [Paludibacteraceae bacterium]HRR58621.1 RnfABCDGE type electron transport complex subunit G [Paludibacteraceae bacterium]HRU72933.1 RnfABCDGE type electron transport complex subunit G [Paludibacteraceae bacterium]